MSGSNSKDTLDLGVQTTTATTTTTTQPPQSTNHTNDNIGTAGAAAAAAAWNEPPPSQDKPTTTAATTPTTTTIIPATTSTEQAQQPPFSNITTTTLEKPAALLDHRTSRVVSASETILASKPKSVTALRKDILLEQARAARLEWIRQVPFPYQVQQQQQQQQQHLDPLHSLRETHAGRQLPAALQVLEYLYGIQQSASASQLDPTTVERIQSIIQKAKVDHAVPTPEQARQMALAAAATTATFKDDSTTTSNYDDEYTLLAAYHSFLQSLADPTAAMLVQHMRNFVRNIPTLAATHETLCTVVHTYMASTWETIQAHALWKVKLKTNTAENNSAEQEWLLVRRAMESFLYGHIRTHIDHVLWTTEWKIKEQEWQDRMAALQFVTAEHLEVSCFQHTNNKNNSVTQVKEWLQQPMQALISVIMYHSPYEKLQRILKMYHAINAALKRALNQNNNNSNATTQKQQQQQKLPSADDILPTIILTVLAARPPQLSYHLQLIEDFCPPHVLRGEAGYAYTNLYGALQFLSDMDLTGTQTPTLTMTKQEFQQGLLQCRTTIAAAAAVTTAAKTSTFSTATPPNKITVESGPKITPRDIQVARQAGQEITTEWARNIQQQRKLLSTDRDDDGTKTEEITKTTPLPQAITEQQQQQQFLFKRSYTFLTMAPEDVKVSDLPLLLEEYRMMVHTTEELLAERQARSTNAKKQQLHHDEHELIERAKRVDPSLLVQSQQQHQPPSKTNSSSSSSNNNTKQI